MRRLLGVVVGSLAVVGMALAAPKAKDKRGDTIWIHPKFGEPGLQSVALLPAASFDNNLKSEKTAEVLFAQAMRPTGYRWVSPTVVKDMLRATEGDAAIAAIDQEILKNGRVDSLRANRVCRALRVGALMSTRVDLFEQVQVEWNQRGKPSTTIQARAALVDSTGRLLWMAVGSETGEGLHHDPNATTLGVKGSGLNTEPVTGQGGAPSFEEVSTRLFARWGQHFPPYRAPGTAPAAAAPAASAPAAASAAPDSAAAPDSSATPTKP